MQPVTAHCDDLYVLLLQADLLTQFPVQGLFGGLIFLNTTLRELPGILANTPRPQQMIVMVTENNTHICTKTLCVDHCLLPA